MRIIHGSLIIQVYRVLCDIILVDLVGDSYCINSAEKMVCHDGKIVIGSSIEFLLSILSHFVVMIAIGRIRRIIGCAIGWICSVIADPNRLI